MKTDIAGRAEIELLVNSFYDKVRTDSMIGYLFAHVDWPMHLPVMYNFWESTLFFTASYSGNAVRVHQRLHERMPLNTGHFSRWQQLFLATVDELFEGEKADLARQRALSIATIMQMKVLDWNGIGR